MNVSLRSSPSGRSYDLDASLLDYGLQSAWFIDATNGNDDNPGTQAYPLRTMAEFNTRLCGNYLQQATTLQLVGDVVDEPLQLTATRFKLGASLTVSGTRTQTGSGRVTLVTPLGVVGTIFPFQLTTTGVDWTVLAAGNQIVFSNNTIGWIKKVVDANNVQIGAVTTLTSTVAVTPTAGLTFQTFSLSRAQAPLPNLAAQNTGVAAVTALQMQNLSFDAGTNFASTGMGGVVIAGCEIKINSSISVANAATDRLLFQSCRFTLTGPISVAIKGGSQGIAIFGGAFVGTGGVNLSYSSGNNHSLTNPSFQGVSLGVTTSSLNCNGAHFDGLTNGSIVATSFGGFIQTSGVFNGSNCTGTTFGVDISSGQFLWNGSAATPTLGIASGASNDVRLGVGASAVGFTYATLGTGKQYAFLDAVPPTTTQIQLGGYASMGQLG